MHSNDTSINIQEGDIIKNKKRGDILYYSISQVATLLDQEDSSIRYYTNVFDNILKIEISDKELRYTNKDIDKLEFLINLKDKGMTIKEVQKYCEALPLNIEDLVEVKENNSISIKEIITTIVELENKQINNLKEYLSNRIDESTELSVQKIVKAIGEEQHNQLNLFRDDILNEIKDYVNSKFDIEYKSNHDLYNELSTKIDALISNNDLYNELSTKMDTLTSNNDLYNELSTKIDALTSNNDLYNELSTKIDALTSNNDLYSELSTKIDALTSNNDLYSELSTKIDALTSEKVSLEDSVKLKLDQFNQISSSRDKTLIDEIRRFKNIIERAYYVQQEVDTQKEKVSFLGKLFRTKQ